MRTCFNRHPLVGALVLLIASIWLQQGSYLMASVWLDVEVHRKLFENGVGALFSIWVMKSLELKVYWWSRQLWRRSYLLLLPMSYLLLNLLGEEVFWPGWSNLISGVSASLLTGFLEELLLRGCILMLIYRAMPERNLLQAVLLSSLLFGLAHWVNLLNDGINWIMALAQVSYAFFIGVGFAAVYVRTSALIPLILIHAGINMMDFLTEDGASEPVVEITQVLPAVLICLPLLLYGLFILRASKRSQLVWQS